MEALKGIDEQQTTFPFEVVIGDDFSSDSTLEKIRQFRFTNPNVKVKILERQQGDAYHQARQKHGRIYNFYDILKNCSGKYTALLDGDDYWIDKNKLQTQVSFLEQNPQYLFAFTRFWVKNNEDDELGEDKNGKFFDQQEKFGEFTTETFNKGWYGGVPTFVFRSECFDIEQILRYKYFRDVYLFSELLIKGNGVCLNMFCAVYRIHDNGVFSSTSDLQRAYSGNMAYRELYLKNELEFLKTKYKNFNEIYINSLISEKRKLKAMIELYKFGKDTKDFSRLKKRIKVFLGWRSKKKKNADYFQGSQKYWEGRYASNNNSGAGSYGRLAQFKADVLNEFIINNDIKTVIELGCGDGNQLTLARYPNYIGYDVSQTAIEMCKKKFAADTTKQFNIIGNDNIKKGELVISLDVIYHLIEEDVYHSYMKSLFQSSTKFVIIYSSNYDKQMAGHVKCRKFTDWTEKNCTEEWSLLEIIPNKYPFDKNDPNNTSMADFYIFEKNK